jgi:Na+-driven multidrug efflux pump
MVIGVVVKILLNLLLLNNPSVNIYGASISLIACYFTALLINLILVMKKEKPNASLEEIIKLALKKL